MIDDHTQERATGYVMGWLGPEEQAAFVSQLSADRELREYVRSLQQTLCKVALASPQQAPPPSLKARVLSRIEALSAVEKASSASSLPALQFLSAAARSGWKELPIPGAWLKLLSLERERGYAVLLGKLDAGVRYPAHINVGPEDFYILTGDLHVGDHVLGPGDFHHAAAGSRHEENYSVEGCTLLAVLTLEDPLVAFAQA